MKEKILKVTLSVFIAFVSILPLAWSGNSATIQVSCSIPSVPGLNAPMVETQTLRQEAVTASSTKETATEQSSNTIQEDKQSQIQLAEGQTATQAVTTVYSR